MLTIYAYVTVAAIVFMIIDDYYQDYANAKVRRLINIAAE
jgi:hypothetical protein